jgi:RNase P/RNase MRP subunit POP5
MGRQQQLCNNRSNVNPTSKLIVRCVSPRMNDPKELHTLILFSLRHLYGDFESHSYGMTVDFYKMEEDRACNDIKHAVDKRRNDEELYFVIRCGTESVSAIRASLTIVTPPAFAEDTLYQFDVIKI